MKYFDYGFEKSLARNRITFADVVSKASKRSEFLQFANDVSRGGKSVVIAVDVQVFQVGVLFTKLVKLNKNLNN